MKQKLLCLLLALFMLIPVFVSCSYDFSWLDRPSYDDDDYDDDKREDDSKDDHGTPRPDPFEPSNPWDPWNPTESAGDVTQTPSTDWPIESAPPETVRPETDPFDPGLPDELYFDDMDHAFTIAAPKHNDWGPAWYNQEEDNGDTIDSAIYTRNRKLEIQFGIVIESMPLGGTDTMAFVFSTYASAKKDEIDVLAVPVYQAGQPLIVNDHILPWNNYDGFGTSVEYIDFERDWWNRAAIDSLSILGDQYFLVGDVNWFTMPQTSVCYFNKEVAKKERIENLYDTVKYDDWTFEFCFDVAKGLASDYNGDTVRDENDTYGAIQNTINGVTGFLYGANCETVTMNQNGPTMNFRDTKIKNVIQWLVDFCDPEKGICYTETFDFDHAGDSRGIPIFFDDRALFYFDILMHAENFRDEESDFGILPYPKYDYTQENYVSYVNQWGLVSALPCTASNPHRTAAILHAMGALSRKFVVPAYYEKTLTGKIMRDDESEEMLDIIFENIIYDFGISYCTDLSFIPAKDLVEKNDPDIVTWYVNKKTQIFDNYWTLYAHVYQKQYGTVPEKPKNY